MSKYIYLIGSTSRGFDSFTYHYPDAEKYVNILNTYTKSKDYKIITQKVKKLTREQLNNIECSGNELQTVIPAYVDDNIMEIEDELQVLPVGEIEIFETTHAIDISNFMKNINMVAFDSTYLNLDDDEREILDAFLFTVKRHHNDFMDFEEECYETESSNGWEERLFFDYEKAYIKYIKNCK